MFPLFKEEKCESSRERREFGLQIKTKDLYYFFNKYKETLAFNV
jgi:hypothetical protein